MRGNWGRFRKAFGGYDPKTRRLKPLKFDASQDAYHYLCALTLAVESEVVDRAHAVEQLFASEDDAVAIVKHIQTYMDGQHWLDRWRNAIAPLTVADDRLWPLMQSPGRKRKKAIN